MEIQQQQNVVETESTSYWCHNCSDTVDASENASGELNCDECGDCFIEIVENDEGMEDINAFIEPEEDEQSQSDVIGQDQPAGSDPHSGIGSILSQVLGMPAPNIIGDGGFSRSSGAGTMMFQMPGGGGGGGAGGGLVLMGSSGPVRLAGGAGPAGGVGREGGLEGLLAMLGGGMGPFASMGADGGAQTIGDYAFGNISTIIDHLMQNSPDQRGPPPTAEQVIQNLSTINIDKDKVEANTECAICKDHFELGSESKELPCPAAHIFHEGCIVPWLKQTNSCPVCRFELPTDDPEYEEYRRGRAAAAAAAGGAGAPGGGGRGQFAP